jgi:hypothetical protein
MTSEKTMPTRGSTGREYAAFISYSHADARVARWIHSALEGYHLPAHIARLAEARGIGGARIAPVFLDRADMAAVMDLDAAIRASLEASRALIVVCSPASAHSSRVSEEIAHFRATHRNPRILIVLVDGRPNAIARGLDPRAEAFPEALRSVGSEGARAEPLAADLRAGRDSRKGALLKLVAGLLDVPLDTVYQRDLQRTRRRWLAFGAAAAVAVIGTTTLGLYAWKQRNAAIEAQARAVREAHVARATTDFLVRLFREVDPAQSRGNELLAREVMDRGLDRARVALAREPEVLVPLMVAVGEVYGNLGLKA